MEKVLKAIGSELVLVSGGTTSLVDFMTIHEIAPEGFTCYLRNKCGRDFRFLPDDIQVLDLFYNQADWCEEELISAKYRNFRKEIRDYLADYLILQYTSIIKMQLYDCYGGRDEIN